MNVKFLQRLMREEEGPTTVEYAVMLALIVGVIFAAVILVGTETNSLYSDMGTEFNEAMTN